MSRVSIALTSFNHEKYLRQSIDSVLNQTYKDFDLYVLDDASTDNSWEIINGYSDPRFHAYRNEINRSGDFLSLNPNQINSDFIAIHHSDDAWEPTKLEKQVAFFDENPEVDAVFTHVKIIDEEGNTFSDKEHPYYDVFDQPNRTRYEWLNHFFYVGNALCHPSLLFRVNCVADLIPRKGLVQLPDLDLWVQLCFQHNIHVIQEKLSCFRVRENEANVSGNRPDTRIRYQFEFLQVLQRYAKMPDKDELVLIFPEAEQYINQNNSDLLYALGMLALGLPPNKPTNTPSKLFGLNLLFEALNDTNRSKQLKLYQLFDKKKFIELTTKHDIFSVETIQELNQMLSERDQHIKQLDETIQELNHTQSGRDQHIKKLGETILELNQMQTERDQHIKQLDETILELNQKQTERDQHIKQLDKTILELRQIQTDRDQHIKQLDITIQELNKVNEDRSTSIQNLKSEINARDNSINNLNQSLIERENSIQGLHSELTVREKSIEELNAMLSERHKLNQNLRAALEEHEKSLQDLNAKVGQLDQEILYYARSKSWRITRPLRKFKRLITGNNDD